MKLVGKPIYLNSQFIYAWDQQIQHVFQIKQLLIMAETVKQMKQFGNREH